MTKQIQLKDISIPEDSLYKSQKVKIGSKSVRTPNKAIEIRKVPSSIVFDHRDFKEIYRVFKEKSIQKARTTNHEESINKEINLLRSRNSTDDQITLTFTEFDSSRLPSDKEIEFLTDMSHAHSDITSLPLIPQFWRYAKAENVTQYAKFARECIKTIEQLNNKPIMGVIPMRIARDFLPTILDVYQNEGINAFCIDFQGATVGSSKSKIRNLLRNLKQRKMLEESFMYGINLGSGKLIKDKEVVPARDILSFGMAVDVLGGQHIRPRLPPDIARKIWANKNIEQNRIRLFNKADYGYYKMNRSVASEIYPTDSKVPLSMLQKQSAEKIDKIFNMEQQGVEAAHLREILKNNESPLSYIQSKKYVDDADIRDIKNLRKK